jgi:hypothetical protein
MPGAIKIFISYAHEDEKHKEELEEHFAPWKNNGQVAIWAYKKMYAGDIWDPVIIDHEEKANVIIMMLSAHFFSSRYIQDTELKIALERHKAKKALAIGVLVSECSWEQTEIAQFQILPKGTKSIGTKPIDSFPKAKRAEILKQVVNDIMDAAKQFVEKKASHNKDTNFPKNDSDKENKNAYKIPLPYKQIVEANEKLFLDAMPYFIRQLYAFTNRSIKNIEDQRKSYEKQLEHSSPLNNNAWKLQQFLQLLCREVNTVFFTRGKVRTHFRYLHIKKRKYLKFAAVVSGKYDDAYALTPMPSEGICMIPKAVEHKTPLIYSLNKQWHHGRDPATRPFRDYVTFVLMDNAFLYQGKYLLSMGISFENPKLYRNLYYILTLCRFDDIISDIVKSFAKALNIDIVDTIVENRNLIEEGFYPKKQ